MARIAQSIEVNVPVTIAYNQWTQFEDFPRFMEGVREVQQLDDAHLHWRVDRNGTEVEWDSEITEQVPDRHIAWRDTSGPKNAGVISFESIEPDKTRVQIAVNWHIGEAMFDAGEAGRTMALRLEQDLARYKKLVEGQGQESGAWRGEIHEGHVVSDDGADSASNATDNLIGKPIGQTESERRDTATSESGRHTDGDTQATNHSAGRNISKPSSTWLPNLLQGWDDPRVMVKKMSEEMDQFFERFIGRPVASKLGQGGTSGKWMPPVEVVRHGDQLIICADLPGVKREDVQIEVNHDNLTIEGERRKERPQAEGQGYRRSERSYGRFYRMIPLPAGVDTEAAQASMRDGVLEIIVPVPASVERRGRRIDIQPS